MSAATLHPSDTADAQVAPPAPGPRGRAVGRMMMRIAKSPLDAMDHAAARYGDLMRFDVAGLPIHVVRGAEQVKHILVTNQDNYRKSEQYEILSRVLGQGLVISEGELWQRQRKLVQPMFAKRHLVPFAEHMARAADAAFDQWDRDWSDGTRIDMVQQMSRMTLDVVGRALVGADFTRPAEDFGAALETVLHQVGAAGRSPVVLAGHRLPGMTMQRAFQVQVPRWRAFAASADVLDDVIDGLIDSRLESPDRERDDLLGLLMAARDDQTGEPMTRAQVRDELMTFVTAGHETTANGLSWMWYLLSQSPQARERLLAEVDDVLGDAAPGADAAERLPWTIACFQEAMRLYPPVWHVQRVAIGDDVVAGHHVPAGSAMLISIWATHRDPAVWPNPAGFDPRRFIGDAPKQRPRHAFLPFGGGRRICVGQGFAMMEAAILSAMMARRFTFDFVPGSRVVPDPTVTLRPLHGLPMTVQRR